eukprot:Pgem_evm1s11468
MKKLRLLSDESTPRRWAWELLQNAKDVACRNTVDIKIKVKNDDNDDLALFFSHNGKPFTPDDMTYLIKQVSTKDRDCKGEPLHKKTTGNFGTGFLTTHLLSGYYN